MAEHQGNWRWPRGERASSGDSGRSSNAGDAPLDPSILARFGRLELVARLVVEGVLAGLHPSPFKGFSVEFAEHRQYGPGDEIRHIDWRGGGQNDRGHPTKIGEEKK